MGRLIDAGLVLDNLSGRLESMKDYDAVKDVINNMPTAYDSDKVVEQLEDRKSLMLETLKISEADIDRGRIYGMDKAIEIVKGGGVDGKKHS